MAYVTVNVSWRKREYSLFRFGFIASFRLHCAKGIEKRETGSTGTRQNPMTLVPMKTVESLN